uniref:Uncharacterized protein n=1 Tax=Arundo donax TaxID=35708 RepID=A0A0A9FYL6_ARUDO
MYHKTEPDR